MRTKDDLHDILEFYRNDERLIRFIDKFHEEYEPNCDESCPQEIMAGHIWKAYWEDIGGEGA